MDESASDQGFDSTTLAAALNQGPSPILITDESGEILYTNQKFLERTGYAKEELIGQNASILSARKTPKEVYEKMWATILAGDTWVGELLNQRKNGELYWEIISIAPFKTSDGRLCFVGIWQDVTMQKKRELDLEREAATDPLTGALSRRYILRALEYEYGRMLRYKHPLSGVMIDLDNFKSINDAFGHLTGDSVLSTFVKIIEVNLRTTDMVGRLGGDEFLLLFPETKIDAVTGIAGRIKEMLSHYSWDILGIGEAFSASFGVFSPPKNSEVNVETFISRVDEALLEAKRNGKNQIVMNQHE